MHMSDGLINAPTSLLFVVVAVAGLSIAAWRARSELDERTAPMAGLVAAFVFAVQMVNFPILPGVSGHLLGGALAAILVGPYTGVLCITIVLVVQSLLFADGGVTALGMNITNMALIGVAAGYSAARLLFAVIRRRRPDSVPALGVVGFLAALFGTVCAAMGFVAEYAIGGGARMSAQTVARRWQFWVGFGVAILLIAGVVSYFASSSPDGLDSATLQGCHVVDTEHG